MLANGTLVHASKTENSELFWAIRGAGSSFGIVVEFEFETFAVPEQLTIIDVATKVFNGTKEQAVADFLALQEQLTTKGLDRKLNMGINVISQNVEIVYHGTKEDALRALKPLEKLLSLDWNKNVSSVRQGDWIDALGAIAGDDPLDLTTNYTGVSKLVSCQIYGLSNIELAQRRIQVQFDHQGTPQKGSGGFLRIHVGRSQSSRPSPMVASD